jgi:hypothetical protein
MNKFEHTTVLLQFAKKTFATSKKDVLTGLAPESANTLTELGSEGWELVSVLPYSAGGDLLLISAGTHAALGFFKRAKAA